MGKAVVRFETPDPEREVFGWEGGSWLARRLILNEKFLDGKGVAGFVRRQILNEKVLVGKAVAGSVRCDPEREVYGWEGGSWLCETGS